MEISDRRLKNIWQLIEHDGINIVSKSLIVFNKRIEATC